MIFQEGARGENKKRKELARPRPTVEEADKCLQDALIMFPGLLKPLVDKCNIQPDESVFKNNIFGPMAEYR